MTALALLLCLASPDDLPARVRDLLDAAPVRTGTFEQRKEVKGFKRPLLSRGTYRVVRGQGIEWNTLAPFASQLSIRAGAITSTQDGAEVYHLDAKAEPAVRVIVQLLFSLLAGDLEGLEGRFAISGHAGPRTWAVELVPRADPLRRLFARIALSGDQAVREVHLVEVGGDSTAIQLAPSVVDAGSGR
jgi:hypothetical protein